jgi:hypothetical protein
MKRYSRRRRTSRQSKKQKKHRTRFSRKTRRQKQRGGADLPVPEGSVVGVNLDPKDAYTVPVLVSKNLYEKEVLED